MRQSYKDIIERAGPPDWFDECAVPRYGSFEPSRVANVYAREVAFLLIRCRACGTPFKAAVSWPNASPVPDNPIAELIATRQLCYGDPPNTACCAKSTFAGSVTERVLEYWYYQNIHTGWIRDRVFEGDPAEDRSWLTCQTCGEPGVLREQMGWLVTTCDRDAPPGSKVSSPITRREPK